MATSSPTTIDVVAPHPFAAPVEVARVFDRNGHRFPALRRRRLALDVVMDLGALVLLAWLVPFVILAISSPIVLILWAVLALIHRF